MNTLADVARTPSGERIARLIVASIREAREPYRLTDAVKARSTSAHKTRTDRVREEARTEALCEALFEVERDLYLTPFAVRMAVVSLVNHEDR